MKLKKFRGQKRYYKNLSIIDLNIDFDSWFNLWHTHIDWKGIGNINWKHRKNHLEILFKYFEYLKVKLKSRKEPFQLFGLIDLNDSSNDAIYIHSENPYDVKFPYLLDEYKQNIELKKPWEDFFKNLKYTIIYQKEFDNYLFFEENVGIPIIEEKK